MAKALSAIHLEARLHPMEYYHLNHRRAKVLRKRIQSASPPPRSLFLRYARELIYAGATKKAIRELASLLEGDDVREYRATPATKPVLDLLAAAYLQLGMQQNCVGTHAAASCTLPIRREGEYTRRKGPRSAVVLYEKILRHLQGDYQSRWLLNVASMMLGRYPAGVPAQWRIEGLASRTGRSIRSFHDVAAQLGVDQRGLSGGVSVEDFNNDGFLDVLTTSYGLDDQMKLYVNDGRGDLSTGPERQD